jgi:DNA-binding transcriptional LysR family regulator
MNWGNRIGRRLKLRDLHILLVVVQSGSMTKAARQLSVSNPVVSKAIADLENTLGVRLLDRSPQGIEPTIYGRALLDRGMIAFDELRQAVKHIEFLADPTAGEVRIGASIAIASSFVAAVIARLSWRYPRIVVHLLAGEASISYRALEERSVDLAILRIFAPISQQHLDVEILYDEPYVIVVGARNRWARRRRIELADLVNERWVLPPSDSLVGSVVVEAFLASGLDYPRASVITYTMPARNALVATGRFLSIVPSSVLRFPNKNPALKVLPINLPTTSRPIGIIRSKNRTLNPVAQLFIDCARDVVRSLAKPK